MIKFGKSIFDPNIYWIKVKGIDGTLFYNVVTDTFSRYSWSKGKIKSTLYENLRKFILKKIKNGND